MDIYVRNKSTAFDQVHTAVHESSR